MPDAWTKYTSIPYLLVIALAGATCHCHSNDNRSIWGCANNNDLGANLFFVLFVATTQLPQRCAANNRTLLF
jgi:hypothetical protein